MIRRRAGFTIVELLTVMIVLGLLAGIALLKYIDLRHRARAAEAASDLNTIRLAAYSAMYETGTWPAEVGPGIVPPGMVPYLPRSFTFDKPEYMIDWENFVPPGGGPSGGLQLGVVVTSSQPRIERALQQVLGDKLPFIVAGNTLTFVIIGPDGKS
jgi:prepilin-type N-terminal cleavage/methylation domain-containing protein